MPTHEMEVRRKKVKRLLAQGAGPAEIAKRLDCSRSTVYRDLDAIEEEVETLQRGKITEFLRDLLATFETVNTELWGLYHQNEQPSLKLGALAEVTRTNVKMVDVLQQVGALDRAAEELHVTSDGSPAIEFIVEECDSDDTQTNATASEERG